MRQLGISLLEVLLVLVIGAVLIMMGVRYFSLAQNNADFAATEQQIKILLQASYDWKDGQQQANFSGISTLALLNANLIENTDAQDRWGWPICVAADSADSAVLSVFVPVSDHKICCQLATHLNNLTTQNAAICGAQSPQCTLITTPCDTGTPLTNYYVYQGQFTSS